MGRTKALLWGVALLTPACGARSALEPGVDSGGATSSSGGVAAPGPSQPIAGTESSNAGGRQTQGGSAGDGGVTSEGGSPQIVAGGGTGGAPPMPVAKAISAGTDTTCGLKENGTVWCWGANGNGQLGNGTTTASSVPVQVLGIDTAVAIAAGGTWSSDGRGAANSAFNCAVLRDGTVRCWGTVPGIPRKTSVPVSIPGIQRAVVVAAGNWHACALLESGFIRCWGDNRYGQLGSAVATEGTEAVDVPGIRGAKDVVGHGSDATCALLTGGSVECWGGLPAGADMTTASSSLTEIPIEGAVARRIGAGYHQACAVLANGTVQCWYGLSAGLPVTVADVHSATTVAVGLSHACALLADGTIQCWGKNQFGQLGGVTGAPAAVSGIHDAVAVSVGYNYSCALVKSGSAWCWGSNYVGQLGNGSTAATGDDIVNVEPTLVRGF